MMRATLLLVFLAVACARDVPSQRDSATAPPPGAAPDTATAVDSITLTVHAYYDALERHDLALAASMREDSAAFGAAHGGSDIRNVVIGAPGPMDAAAGSRYVTVPVTFDDSVAGKPIQHVHETVTVRQSVVDGATAAQRRWHIYQIKP